DASADQAMAAAATVAALSMAGRAPGRLAPPRAGTLPPRPTGFPPMGRAREVSVTRAAAGDTRPKATNRMQPWFEDMGTFIAGAVALFVVGSLFLVAAVQSPSMLQWTGTAVRSVESGGLLYYTFHGQS